MKHIAHERRAPRKTGRHTPSRLVLKALPLAAALCCCTAIWAADISGGIGLPVNGTVQAGAATGAVSGNQLTVTQTSNRAVIDWSSFNINAGKAVQFVQPSATSAVLNRVSANAGLSEIYGSLTANGMVLLMNPNGVLFGSGAQINVASLIATTGIVNPTGFMGGGPVSISGATTGAVTNQGTISAQNAGLVALVAPSVRNQGTITANAGTVLLGGASAATISMNGGLYEFATGAPGANVSNSGTIQADGGTVILSAANASAVVDRVINMDGVIQARTVGLRDGVIVLEGGDAGGVQVSGRMDASGTAGNAGGKITVTGRSVDLAAAARLDASGDTAGGTILVGGNWQGKGPERNAQTTTVAAGATLAADAVTSGNGGKVVAWADDSTRFNGAISARGGAAGGDGGMVEVSGKQSLGFAGAVDTSAPRGNTGSLLLDPVFAVISSGTDGTVGDTQTIKAATLVSNLDTTNVTVQADTRVTVDAAVNASTNANAHNLALNAPTVDLNAAITLKTGATLSGNASTVNVNGSNARIQNGVDVAASPATVNVAGGTYGERVTVNKANMTLAGHAGTKLTVADGGEYNGITISANNVTVSGFEIAGPLNSPYDVYYAGNPNTDPHWASISRGVVVSQGATGFAIANNNIHDIRTGILIDGRNSAGTGTVTGSVTGNTIENTKSGISVQYTDGAGLTMSGNSQGSIGNEWGINLHLNGVLDGGIVYSNDPAPHFTTPTLSWQQALLDLGAANGGFSVQDQGYSSSNRTQAMVATTTSTATMQGSRLTPFTNIQSGIDAVVSGGAVNVASGTYTQSSTLRVDKGLTLTGAGEGLTVVDARGITNNYGVNVSADNVILRNFSVYGPTIFDATHQSAYGIKVSPGGGASARLHNLSIANVTSRGAGKAELDLNGVDGALIDHVTADGMPVGATSGTTQGAGIQLTDSANVTVTNTTTRNNAWGGIAIYQANRSYDQQANNITVAANNSLTETNPLYLQDESASRDFGALNLPGFSYAVRNTATIGTGPSAVQYSQYTWMQPTPQGSFDLAVNLLSPVSSYVQTWNGTAVTQNFHVGVGNLAGGGTQAMSISAATDRASSGATVNVAAGTYDVNLVLNNPYKLYFDGVTVHSVTLNAAAGGTGIAGTVTADGSGGIHINAPINLLGDTTLATRGADIVISGDVQNAPGVIGGLRLMAGTNTARGNVSLATGGAETNALGPLEVFSNRFNLQDTLWVKSYKIDALGDVALSGHTLRGQDPTATNTMNAGGNVTGSTINTGNVQISSNGDVSANVSGNDVSVNSVGNLDLTVTATNSATLHGDTVAATVSARDVAVTSQSNMNVDVTASNSATLSGQAVVATVVARDVAVTSQGDMNVGVVATNSATLQGGSVVANVASPVVSVGATNDAQISGVSGSITVDAPSGSVTGNFGQFTNEGGGLVSFNGKPQGNETLVASSVNNRVNPVGNPMSGDANPDEWSGIPAAPFDGAVKIQGRVHSGFSSPSVAGSFLDQGQSVELDLSPRNERRKK